MRRTLFPPLDKRNTRDKAKGLRVSSERHIGVSWALRCLSPLIEDRTIGSSLYLDALPQQSFFGYEPPIP